MRVDYFYFPSLHFTTINENMAASGKRMLSSPVGLRHRRLMLILSPDGLHPHIAVSPPFESSTGNLLREDGGGKEF